jgi:hypothetical protein
MDEKIFPELLASEVSNESAESQRELVETREAILEAYEKDFWNLSRPQDLT